MSSESGQKYSLEELKQMNRPPDAPSRTTMSATCPTPEEWDELTQRLDLIESNVAKALTLLHRRPTEEPATRQQVEALTVEVAALRTMLQPDGRRNGRRCWRPSLSKEDVRQMLMKLLVIPILLGAAVALYAIFSSSLSIWNVCRTLFP